MLPRASISLTLAVAVCLVVAAVVPLFLMLSVGWSISDIGAVVGRGSASAGAKSLTLTRPCGLLTLLRVVVTMTTPIGDQVALRVRAGVFQRVVEAHLAPPGVAHLEDPTLRDSCAPRTRAR